jgi:hypothetical protein
MTPEEFRAIMQRLCITPGAFADLLAISPRTGQRWAAGKAHVPPSEAMVARVLDAVADAETYTALAGLLVREAQKLETAIAKGE